MENKKLNIEKIASSCFKDVFRNKIERPGFIHLDFGPDLSSHRLREIMIQFKESLSAKTEKQFKKKL